MHFPAVESGGWHGRAFRAVNYVRKRFRTYFDLHMGTAMYHRTAGKHYLPQRAIRRHRAVANRACPFASPLLCGAVDGIKKETKERIFRIESTLECRKTRSIETCQFGGQHAVSRSRMYASVIAEMPLTYKSYTLIFPFSAQAS